MLGGGSGLEDGGVCGWAGDCSSGRTTMIWRVPLMHLLRPDCLNFMLVALRAPSKSFLGWLDSTALANKLEFAFERNLSPIDSIALWVNTTLNIGRIFWIPYSSAVRRPMVLLTSVDQTTGNPCN